MCQPKQATNKVQATNLYKLKSYVKRKQPAHAIQFEDMIKTRSFSRKYEQSLGSSVSNQSSQLYEKKTR